MWLLCSTSMTATRRTSFASLTKTAKRGVHLVTRVQRLPLSGTLTLICPLWVLKNQFSRKRETPVVSCKWILWVTFHVVNVEGLLPKSGKEGASTSLSSREGKRWWATRGSVKDEKQRRTFLSEGFFWKRKTLPSFLHQKTMLGELAKYSNTFFFDKITFFFSFKLTSILKKAKNY